MLTPFALDKIERIAVALERIADVLEEHRHEREQNAPMPVVQVDAIDKYKAERQLFVQARIQLGAIGGNLDTRWLNTLARYYSHEIDEMGFDAWAERCLDGTIDLLSARNIGPTYRERVLAALRAWKSNGKRDS